MMTAEGSTGGTSDDTRGPPTLEDHPGLDNDEATDEGKKMTAEGSTGATATRRTITRERTATDRRTARTTRAA